MPVLPVLPEAIFRLSLGPHRYHFLSGEQKPPPPFSFMPTSPDVLIAGAGIAGLAAAIGLRKRGIEAVVLEQATELREIGAGLLLAPNACAVLHQLGALAPMLEGPSLRPPAWELRSWKGHLLSRLSIAKPHEISLSTRRSDLQAALRSCLPASAVMLGQTVKGAAVTSNGVLLEMEGGRRLEAKKVIIADGAHSQVRASLWPGRQPRYSGYIGWRGLVDYEHGDAARPYVCESWGKGRRFGIATVGGGKTYWYASASVPAAQCRERVPLEQLKRDFAGWHHPVADILAAMPEEKLLQHPISDRRPAGPWHIDEKIVLIGDAAHPLTPNLGQGASMALEDAWELAAAWRPHGMADYERKRKARVHRLWALSNLLGRAIQLKHPALTWLRDFQMNISPDAASSYLMRRLLHYNPSPMRL
jgi:2-polyprenyl-6-methoxyphenol hydroxylase-like FAD-dependent oxidoreductase